MSSDEYYFSPQKDHPLSLLQDQIDLGSGEYALQIYWWLPAWEELEDRIKFLRRELKVMDSFLGLQSFTNECSMLDDVIQNVQTLFLYAVDRFRRSYLHYSTIDVLEKIWRTKMEMRAKYSTSVPLSSYEGNIAATPEFVKKFVDTVARSLSDLLNLNASCSSLFVPVPRRQIEEVVKELKFLRNFVYLISDRCTDPQIQHTFFTHVLVMGGRAAMGLWLNFPDHNKGKRPLAKIKMDVSFSDLQILMQPIQQCIRKICVDFLQALKSEQSGQIEYVADCEAGFEETLIHHLEKLPIISMNKEILDLKDHKAILQEMLIILRANLIDLPMKDLIFLLQDIDIIIDAGLLVSSLYDCMEEKEDMDVPGLNQVSVLDFSASIQSVQEGIYLIFRKTFQSKLPKIDGPGFIDIILDKLKDFLGRYSDSRACIKSQLQTIQKELQHFQKQHDGSQNFAMQVIAKALEVEHIVIACINKDVPQWFLVRWIGEIVEEITQLSKEIVDIHEKEVADLVLHNTNCVAGAHTSQFARITSMKEEMVGFDEVVDKLRQQLIRGSSILDVISIVGMAGLGKTTLANKLYHDKLVVSHFDIRAECCVSQSYARKDLLLAILRGVKDTVISDKTPENELADRLRRLLLAKRYLIFVDDIWEKTAWDDLKPCFYDANNGSRIILTTRLADVASHAKLVSDPHFLRLFTLDESWMLLENKVFNGKSCPLVLEDTGKKIVQKCGGLPLSIVLVAGILETMEKEKHCWEQVATNLGPHIQSKSEDIIDLSYQNLPYHLKPCFLYFGAFLEDEQIHISKLIWLWTAEGFVNTHREKLSEDTARCYLENLIGRNLVMVAKKSSDGKIKACRIHDLLLDFCRKKAKVENFLEWIKGYKGMDPSSSFKHHTRGRLSVYSQGANVAEWSSICSHVPSFRFRESKNIVLSSIDRASYTFNNFMFLRVLDLEFTLIDSFPEALTCLRYVAIRTAEDSSLSFLANLLNLETMIVKGIGGRVSLPDTLWKMVKLRHLHIYNHAIFTSCNVQEFLESPSKMVNLQTLSSARFSSVEDADNILANTPNLQKLRCEVLKFNNLFPAFNNLAKLEMLKFSSGRQWIKAIQLNFPQILKKLTLFNSGIHSLDQVATLPRLEVLKLLQVTINPKVWEVTNEQFPQLRFLKLQSPSFSELKVSDEAFPCLEHLVLSRCRHLKEIPSRFEDASSLKSVEIISCNEALAKSAMDVRETLIDNSGTSGFDVFIHK